MKINIIGAGMAGLLAANILRRHDVVVIEKQKELPNNHHAVLRFRTPIIGDILGIPFKKVNMIKTYVPNNNIVADSLSYSKKTTGIYRSDRSIIEGTVIAERYVAPPDLIEQMSKNIKIIYDKNFTFKFNKDPIISTIPIPSLMMLLGYDTKIIFKKISGTIVTATIEDCDAYVSVLFPGEEPYSRITITGNELMIEFPESKLIQETIQDTNIYRNVLGYHSVIIYDVNYKKQDYFKITEINEVERTKFMRWASVNHNIYSLGRYATWRPKLLLDDLIQDIKKIEGWMTGEAR